tara:strand:+ start:1023 stop:1526 length:504 start_codon:yes stop_codon:yes gene_type:complete
MNNFLIKGLVALMLFFSSWANAANLADDARNRGINETCLSYLSQIDELYSLNGLNITFAHPENPSKYPSLHISTKKYNNGSSSFSATLTPDGEYCYISSIMITSINNQSCSKIAEMKVENENLQLSSYGDDSYIILTPIDESYQTILTSSNENNCTMTEARMMWPGR